MSRGPPSVTAQWPCPVVSNLARVFSLPSPAPDLARPARSACLTYTQPQAGPATTALFHWGQLHPCGPLLPAPFQALRPKGPDAQRTSNAGGGGVLDKKCLRVTGDSKRHVGHALRWNTERLGHSQPRPLKGPQPQTRSSSSRVAQDPQVTKVNS